MIDIPCITLILSKIGKSLLNFPLSILVIRLDSLCDSLGAFPQKTTLNRKAFIVNRLLCQIAKLFSLSETWLTTWFAPLFVGLQVCQTKIANLCHKSKHLPYFFPHSTDKNSLKPIFLLTYFYTFISGLQPDIFFMPKVFYDFFSPSTFVLNKHTNK